VRSSEEQATIRPTATNTSLLAYIVFPFMSG
jgi:hypothetical protein